MTRLPRDRRSRRGRTKSAASARRDADSRSALFKILLVAIVVIAFGTVYFVVASSKQDLDDETRCPSKVTSVTVLLVDVTDPMNTPQRQDFSNQLTKLKNSIPQYGQLMVAKVDATKDSLLNPVIIRCNPGTANDVSAATGDPDATQRDWEENFDKPLTEAFEQIATASNADQSPILESIQSVALTQLQKPGQEAIPKRLVVASDLLQNTGDVSFYRGLPDAREFVDGATFRRLRTDLRGVDVELWMLERSDAASTQPRSLADLWDNIIGAEGGTVRRIYNVSG